MLGTAALVAPLARPPEDDGDPTQPVEQQDAASGGQPTATERPSGDTAIVRMRAGGRREVRRVEPGRPVTLVVAVEEPGQVSIPSLGLLQPAEPLTPARFDILVSEPSRHPVETDPVAPGQTTVAVGLVRVVGPPSRK